jgi:hypothetical protein
VMHKEARSVGATSANSGIKERAPPSSELTYRMNEKDSER